jgi:molybdopterin/thiamine biosynthesis adenylyltransferase
MEHVTSMDGDAIDEEGTNLNRYCLTTTADIGTSKALIAERVLAAHNIPGFAFAGTWEEYQVSERWGQRADLRSLEASFRYESVLSCVDKNPARHSIQRFWPRVLLGGSTLGLSISVVNYDMQRDFECLMCGNPLPVDSWSVDEQANALRAMTSVARQRLAEARGADAATVEAYLNDESCGHLGLAEIKKFRIAPDEAEWSVGFVSVAAGVLLAVETIRTVGFGVSGSDTGAAHRFTFGSVSGRTTAHRRRRGCECLTSGLKRFKENWLRPKEVEG